METIIKRKTIEIPLSVFKKLSILAATKGENLKKFIESVLIATVQDVDVTVKDSASENVLIASMNDDDAYAYLSKNVPEGHEKISAKEKEELEKILNLQ